MKNDFISRSELLKTLRKEKIPYDADINYFITTAPAADVAPIKRGHWIRRKNWDRYVCSECSNEEQAARNFCPCCGADMFNEEERTAAK